MVNKNTSSYLMSSALVLLVMAVFSGSAFAHHPMGGGMPTNFSQGLLSGIGHPIIGLDHLAFIIAAGILAWQLAKPMRLIASFIAATVIGCLAVSYGLSFSATEPLVLLSVGLIGIVLARKSLPKNLLAQIFYPLAGFFHGCAYGGAVIGAEATPVIAYLLGFAVIQFAIAFAAHLTVRWFASQSSDLIVPRLAGAVICGVALTYGFEMTETALFAAL